MSGTTGSVSGSGGLCSVRDESNLQSMAGFARSARRAIVLPTGAASCLQQSLQVLGAVQNGIHSRHPHRPRWTSVFSSPAVATPKASAARSTRWRPRHAFRQEDPVTWKKVLAVMGTGEIGALGCDPLYAECDDSRPAAQQARNLPARPERLGTTVRSRSGRERR